MTVSHFPFSAVVGMDDMRLALTMTAIDPGIGGVLVRGEKGTAKSTTIRALATVLPTVDVVGGCRFSCSPSAPDPMCPDGPHSEIYDGSHGDGPAAAMRPARLVELPVGATDDRLTGSLDVGRALTEGVTTFQPGLLAAAHRGVLYVDEVNLLSDHLVDLLLDAAAMGRNYVERDTVSVRHAAKFLLVGTMNPEEGELRPQLLDRFGLTVEVAAPRDAAVRAEIVRRRMAFDADPDGFAVRYAPADAELAEAIAAARATLPAVALTDRDLIRIARVCAAFDVDGLRADLVIARTAAAHAAWCGREAITREDVRVAARLALPHRQRRNPFDAPGIDEERLERILDEAFDDGPEDPEDSPGPDDPAGPEDPAAGTEDAAPESGADGDSGDDSPGGADDGTDGGADGPDASGGEDRAELPPTGSAVEGSPSSELEGESADGPDTDVPVLQPAVAAGAPYRVRTLRVPGRGMGAAGRRSRAVTEYGRTIGSQLPVGPARDIDPVATLITAAPHQLERGRRGAGLHLIPADLRERRREGREANLVLFAVDASGSMAARKRMSEVKAAVLSLLLDAYQRRDKVGMIAFRGRDAELLLPPTSSVDAAAARLDRLPTGGRTPLAAGLAEARAVLAREKLRDPSRRALLVVVTDGRHTHGPNPAEMARLIAAAGTASVVVDCEAGPIRLGMATDLARHLAAPCWRPEELSGAALTQAVRDYRTAA